MGYPLSDLVRDSGIIIYEIATARRDESGEFYLPHFRVGTSRTGLRTCISRKSLDYCPRLAAQNPLGGNLLPSPGGATRICRRVLERIEGGFFSITGGPRAGDSSCSRGRTRSLGYARKS
jgi:hypothetical protein